MKLFPPALVLLLVTGAWAQGDSPWRVPVSLGKTAKTQTRSPEKAADAYQAYGGRVTRITARPELAFSDPALREKLAQAENWPLPPRAPAVAYSAADLNDYSKKTLEQLGAYFFSEVAPSMSLADAKQKELFDFVSGAHTHLAKGQEQLDAALGELLGGMDGYNRIVAKLLLIVSGNKIAVGLISQVSDAVGESVDAMAPAPPTPGADVDAGPVEPVYRVASAELIFADRIENELDAVERKISGTDPLKGKPEIAAAQELGRRAGELERNLSVPLRRKRVSAANIKGGKDGALAMKIEYKDMRDAPAAEPAVFSRTREHLDGAGEMNSLASDRAQISKGEMDELAAKLYKAIEAVRACSRMQITAAETAKRETEKINKANKKLDSLAGEYATAQEAAKAAVAARAEALIEELRPIKQEVQDAANASAMTNQRAMEALGEAAAYRRQVEMNLGS